MFWYGNGMSGWGWFVMALGMILFWALLGTLGVFLVRALTRPPKPPAPRSRPAPQQLLDERFARGEIDEEEYHRRSAVLRQTGAVAQRQ